MNPRQLGVIVFACVSGSAMLGFLLGKVLPDRHLSNDSKDIVKLATGLIATLSALVLGLLVSSAKETFDEVNNELTHISVKILVLDRVLAQYGPETTEIRAMLKSSFSAASEQLLSGNESQQAKLNTPEAVGRMEAIWAKIRALTPQNDAQRVLQSRAIALQNEISNSRWLLVLGNQGSISTAMLVVMVSWLGMIFVAWGMFAPRNPIVAAALLAGALSVSGATFLILELDRPLVGWIRVSAVPMKEAIAHLGE